MANTSKNHKYRKWTKGENDLLVRQVRAFPGNLSKCFLMVAESTGRSPKAVMAHWYKVVSKDPNTEVCYGFLTQREFAKNRKGLPKNGGMPHSTNIFKRILKVLGFN